MVKVVNIWKAVLITAVSIAAFFILYFIASNFDLSPGSQYRVVFDYVGTINRGSLLRKSGLKIGTVRDLWISPEDQKSVIVQISIARGQSVRTGDKFAIVTRGILGDQYVEVFPGPIDAPVAQEGFVFKGVPMLDFNSLVIQGGALMQNLVESTETLNRLLSANEDSISNTLRSIEALTASLQSVTGSTDEIANFVPDMKEQLSDSMRILSQSVASLSVETQRLIGSLNSQVGRTTSSLNKSLDSVSGAADQFNRLLANLNRQDSFLSRLNQPGTSEDVVKILQNLERTTEHFMTASAEIRKSVEDLLGSGDSQ